MSFKKKKAVAPGPTTPVGLLPLLTRRTIPDAMSHQKEMLEAYANEMVEKRDVAMQLPTGSGKTLVGLLIAEWRRRKFRERVVYLCPTRQLVHQTVAQAQGKYGIDALAFAGKRSKYVAGDVTSYRTGAGVAVSTYSSLFNVNPFFSNPDTIILDDVHAAENYIAKMWSLEVPSGEGLLSSLYHALADVIKPHITPQSFARLTGEWKTQLDATWVDKLPTKTVAALTPQLADIISAHEVTDDDTRFKWSLLRDHLHACHVYLSSRGILIRPLVPPTWSHPPFAKAKQRLYMSATLGAGGDLERLTGREKISRIPAPQDFRGLGVGRRFFIFPGLSLESAACETLRKRMQISAGRSVVLTANKTTANAITKQFEDEPDDFELFSAVDIEDSKTEFIKAEKAAAIMAGRFDGIDFPNDECRLLCLDGLPRAINAQERFLMTKMGAAALFNERMQTRVLQAAGRCTRALQDRSAVLVTGHELLDYLTDDRNWRHFHPELQAELAFGVLQSSNMCKKALFANFESFMANDADWDEANREIVDDARNFNQAPYPAMDELEQAVTHEVHYQKALWSGDFECALTEARAVSAILRASELRGYRALWHYLAGSVSQMLSVNTGDSAEKVAQEQFAAAMNAAPSVPWLASLARGETANEHGNKKGLSADANVQVERLEGVLLTLGTASNHKFEKFAKEILDALKSPNTFEEGQRKLGELIGFIAGNSEVDGAPDPWWLGETKGLVFEDHAGGNATTTLGAKKARQAAMHPDWLEENVQEAKGLKLEVALVTPCASAGKGAKPVLKKVRYWKLSEFRAWAAKAIGVVRGLKSTLPPDGDLFWRADAADTLTSSGLTIEAIIDGLPIAAEEMTFGS